MNVPDVPCVTTAESLSPDLNVPVQTGIQSSENLNALQIVVSIIFFDNCVHFLYL